MGEGAIVDVMVGPEFGIGFSYQWRDQSVLIVVPFVMINITFKRKTHQNEWYSFVNHF